MPIAPAVRPIPDWELPVITAEWPRATGLGRIVEPPGRCHGLEPAPPTHPPAPLGAVYRPRRRTQPRSLPPPATRPPRHEPRSTTPRGTFIAIEVQSQTTTRKVSPDDARSCAI